MKKIFLLIFFSPLNLLAQNGWNYLPGPPVDTRYDDIYFINDSTGWAVNTAGRIYKTTDYGDSWTQQISQFQYFRSIEFLDSLNGFAGTLMDTSVYYTTDGGITWNIISPAFPAPVWGICGMGHFGNTIIMVGVWNSPAYVLRSIDAGQTWTMQLLTVYADALIDCWFKDQDTVFISGRGTDTTGNYGIILRSVDGGITWNQVGQSPNPDTYCWKLQFTSPSTGYSSCEESISSASHILKTIDGGATWFPLTVVNQNINMQGIGFLNDSTGWVGGYSLGMYQTNDGGNNWSYLNFGQSLNKFIFLKPNLGYASGTSVYKFTGLTTGTDILPDPGNNFVHQFDLFPNPSTGNLNITLHINKNTYVIFEIFDNNGKSLMELAHEKMNKSTYNYQFNSGQFPEGNYFVVLRTNEHFITKSFMVVR